MLNKRDYLKKRELSERFAEDLRKDELKQKKELREEKGNRLETKG